MPGSDELGIFFCGKILTAFSDRTDKSRVQMPDTFISRLMPSRHKDIKKNPLYKFCELFRNNCRFLTHVSCSPLFPHLTLKIHKKKNFTSLVCDAWYQRAKTTKTFWLKVIIHKTLPRSENIYMTSAVSPPLKKMSKQKQTRTLFTACKGWVWSERWSGTRTMSLGGDGESLGPASFASRDVRSKGTCKGTTSLMMLAP